jgi:hypothetical protein
MNFFKAVGYVALALAFVLAAVFSSAAITKWQAGEPVPTATSTPPIAIRPVVTCPKDSRSYEAAKQNKNLVLLSTTSSYGKAGEGFIKESVISLKRSGLNSQIACGYLFYRVSAGNHPINQQYENLYMIPTQGEQFGGHILPDGKNTITNDEVNGKTEILLPLDDISYDGTDRKNIKRANWVSLLNVSDQIDFTIALNTTNLMGGIDSVEIAYKCWNPETGQETTDCELKSAN